MRPLRLLACLAVLAASACTIVSSNVESYSAIPADISPRTVTIGPGPGMEGQSLAWQQNARLLAGVLAERGFASVPRGQARLNASYAYEVRPPVTEYYDVRVPIRGIRGYDRQTAADGSVRVVPIYGTIGHRTETRDRTVYPRDILITMQDTRSNARVFEARASSRSTCADTPKVLSLMAAGVLEAFPAARNGRVSARQDDAC